MEIQRILVIALLSNKKLKDKLLPLTYAYPNAKIFVLRRKRGYEIKNVEYITIPQYLITTPILSALALMMKGLSIIPKIKPSLLISYFFVPNGIISLLLGKLYCKKTICSIIGSDQLLFNKKQFSTIYIKLLQKSTAVVVTGTRTKKKFQQLLSKNSKIELIPNTIKVKSQTIPYRKRDIDFVFIGNLIPLKQVDIIIKAFINLSESLQESENLPILYIIGDGPERQKLEGFVKEQEYSQRIKFTGYQKDVNKYLAKSKFVNLASTNEGLPVVLIEGMMNGCIPITTNVGDVNDLMSTRNGFVINYSHDIEQKEFIKQYEAIMRKALNLKESEYESISKYNIKTAKKYDYSKGGEYWYRLINAI